jgi:glycosyltransferase involved in cell wall biosynthesis
MQLPKEVKNSTILLTSANYFTIAKFRYSFVSKLISNGHKVVLYSSYDDMSINSIENLEKLGAICIKTGNGRGSYSVFEAVNYIVGYINILNKYSVDIAINFTLMPMILGGLVCRFKKLSFISVVTGLGSQYHGHFIKRFLFKFVYSLSVKYSNHIWFVSHSDARIGINELRLNPDKIRVVYGAGIKINYSKNSLMEKNSYKEKIKTQIICMGRIRKDKGIEDFIALANKLSLDDRFSLLLMGSMDSTDEYINNIVNQAIYNNLIKKIDFNSNNLQQLKSADVLLLCSKHEGMPTVVLESMAHNVIPIAANIEVIDELKKMGAIIYSYIPGNIDSLYEKIIEIEGIRSSEKELILKKNHEFVSRHFDQNDIANLQYGYLLELAE